jgi:hypothetical protein
MEGVRKIFPFNSPHSQYMPVTGNKNSFHNNRFLVTVKEYATSSYLLSKGENTIKYENS